MNTKFTLRSIIATLVLLIGIGVGSAQAQNYSTAVGLRAGYGLGLTGKHFFSDAIAAEAIVRFRSNTFFTFVSVQALAQVHNDLDDVLSGLSWYYGGGALVSIASIKNNILVGDRATGTSIGISGNLGLDIALGDLPLNISVDWIPTFFVGSGATSGFAAGNGGVAIRYILP